MNGTRAPLRAGVVLAALWVGTAVLLRGTDDFGAMIAILACASLVLAGPAVPSRGYLPGQIVLWSALLVATAVILWGSPRLPGVVAWFAGAAAWFSVLEPTLLKRRVSQPR